MAKSIASKKTLASVVLQLKSHYEETAVHSYNLLECVSIKGDVRARRA